MSFQNLFIRSNKSIGGIRLDAVIRETHSNKVRLSTNPVELGADISDHAVVEPKKVNIIAQVSDSPLGTAAFSQIIDLITGLFGTSTSPNLTRSTAAYNALVQLMELREPIELQTKLILYENMLITSITTGQDKNTSRVVLMTINLEEVIIVQTQIETVEKKDLAKKKDGSASTQEQGTPASKKGKIEPKTPDENTNTSVLKTTLDWLGL